jgi:hypothetical protein
MIIQKQFEDLAQKQDTILTQADELSCLMEDRFQEITVINQ